MRVYSLLAASLILSSALMAQESDEASRAPDRGPSVRIPGIQILPATGKPFSGRDHIEWTRKLEDGTVVASELYALLARDSQGRIYREHVSFVPANSNQQSIKYDIVLLNPVAHTRTTCMIAKQRCLITGYYASATFKPAPAGPFPNGKGFLTRESLGPDVIDGFNVIGTRETITINPGIAGNNQPLVIPKEFWYSPDLEINLLTTRKDPREGTQIIRVVDISRTDPDPAVFQIPEKFAVVDERQLARTAN